MRKKLVIVGMGTAGSLSAAHISRWMADHEVEWHFDPNVPPQAVGEGSTVEGWAFGTKLSIIIPGLLFDKQWWWLYFSAVASSLALILTSTIKTLLTIIWFNVAWVLLAITAIIKHFI